MAKRKQKLNRRNEPEQTTESHEGEAPVARDWIAWARLLAMAVLGGLPVYLAYYPSDSILVEQGDALWFCAGTLLLVTVTMATEPLVRIRDGGFGMSGLLGRGLIIDLLAWNLAAWIMLCALATCPPGNLRGATNEAWLWLGGAAMLTAARRLLADHVSRAGMISLMFAITMGFAVHALHQNWISLPQTRAAFLEDPEKVMREAGVEAPEWSSRSMVFANRLLDGGPTATFALANSLATTLPVAILIATALLFRRRQDEHPIYLTAAIAALLLAAALALIATRSRSAVAGCLLGLGWLWLGGHLRQSTRTAKVKQLLLGGTLLAAAAGVITIGFLLFGDEEWMAAAPSSLEFRLQYWRATLAMLWEHPWMGAGPGGFQSLYLKYRLPVAGETIADPHNFVFETLAAGGIIAGAMLIALVVALTRFAPLESASEVAEESSRPSEMLFGAVTSLVLIWLLSLASNQLPDLDASLFVVPTAAASYLLTAGFIRRIPADSQRGLLMAILVAMMTHLCFAGGWTVPGVAVWVWVTVAMLTPATSSRGESENAAADEPTNGDLARRVSLVAFAVGCVLVLALRFVSISPVQSAMLAKTRADDALRRGLWVRVDEESRNAMEADPWGFDAPLWRSEVLRGRVIGGGRDRDRDAWKKASDEALGRSGRNPLVVRAVAEQHLHFYQRFGRPEDLRRADELLADAMSLNPTDVAIISQSALVADQRGETARALDLARRAETLSLLGGDVVRALGLVHVLAVEPLGAAASERAQMRRVEPEFAERFGVDFR